MKINQKNFTLIELVVVLSIIMVLSTMLVTALALVKEGSRTTQCANQLRQINTGVIMYSYDSNGYLPQNIDDEFGVGYWWFELVDGNNQNYSKLPAVSGGYTRSKELWLCPNDVEEFAGFHCNMLSYGYNYRYLGNYYTAVKVKLSQIYTPSEVISVGDSRTTKSYGKNRCVIEPSYTWTAGVSRRHNDGSNIMFVDGHGDWGSYTDIDSSGWWEVR